MVGSCTDYRSSAILAPLTKARLRETICYGPLLYTLHCYCCRGLFKNGVNILLRGRTGFAKRWHGWLITMMELQWRIFGLI